MPFLPLLLLLLAAGCSELLSDGYEYGTVDVQVVRRSGEPVPGVRLVLYTWSHHLAYGETDESGRHLFEFVPPGAHGVRAVPEEPYVTFTGYASVADDDIGMEEGGREEVRFTLLKRGPGTIRVRVTAPSGAAVPGTAVSLYAYHGGVADGITGPDGEYEFAEVPFGDYGVRITPSLGFAAPDSGRTFLDGIIVDEGSLDTIDFRVERCTGVIRVRVADPAGRPVAGVGISLYTFRGLVEERVTDASGTAEFPAAPCANLGVALQEGLGYTFSPGRGGSFVDDIAIRNGVERDLSFVVTPCTGTIRARVVDDAGASVPGAGLVLYSFRGEIVRGETDADGVFVFERAPCGELGVRVIPPDGFTVEEGARSSYFDALKVENRSERSVRFVLSRS